MTSSAEQFRRIQDIFALAADYPPDQREEVLARECADDPALRRKVEGLLRAHDGAGLSAGALGSSLGAVSEWGEALRPGDRIGSYVIRESIGEGGMGAVFAAERVDGAFDGRVAIKTLLVPVAGSQLASRFLRERQILARLQHPNIATLLDGGTTDRGAPWLAMEFVAGATIDAHCDDHRLGLSARLDLFRQVCAAIHYAHRKLVIHRDLKPGNILVTPEGTVKLLDFGIAKLLTPEDEGDAPPTRDGGAPLTVAYASPEQVRGDELTTASDVYSTGVVLYRLLTGVSPHRVEGKTPSEVREMLSRETPQLPSDVATDAHATRMSLPDGATLRRLLRGELDAIVMMALRREPERRYASAEALSEDVLRYLRRRPVSARPDTVGYRVSSFVRRNRALVVGSSLSIVAMLTATAVSMRQSRIARDEATRATRITQYLQAVVGAADPSHYSAVRTGGSDVGLMEVLDSTRSRAGRDLADAPRVRADLYWSMANSYRAFGRTEMALQLFDSARALHAATVGDPSLEVARDIHFAGLVHQLSGRPDDAINAFREALSRYDRLRAVPDSERTDIETSLGQLLTIGQRKFVEGDSLLHKALRRELAAKNPRPDLVRLLHGAMASSLLYQGRWIASDSIFALADASFARDPARLRGDRAVLHANWARLKNRTGRYEEAHALVTDAIRDFTAMAGTGSMYEVIFRMTSGEALLGLGRARDAKAMLDTALRYMEALPAPGAAYRNELHRLLGLVAISLGDLHGASAHLKTAESLVPEVSPTVRTTSLVQTLIAWGAYEMARGDTAAAERRYRSALDSARARDGDGSQMALRAMSELARFERARGGGRVADSLLADSARLSRR